MQSVRLAGLRKMLSVLLMIGTSLSAVSKEPTTTCPKKLQECVETCDKVIKEKDDLIAATGDALSLCMETNSGLRKELQDKNAFWRDPAFIWPTAGAAGILLTLAVISAAGGLSK